MLRMRILILCCVVVVLSWTGGHAQNQNQKIAFVDGEYILEKIPDYKGLTQKLEVLAAAWRDEASKLQQEIDEKTADFKAKEILFTDEVKKQKQSEIEGLVKAKDRFLEQKFGPDGDYFKQQQDLLYPIQQKIVEAINKVAEAKGFDFVFDRSGSMIFFYANTQFDLSNDVLAELGIEVAPK